MHMTGLILFIIGGVLLFSIGLALWPKRSSKRHLVMLLLFLLIAGYMGSYFVLRLTGHFVFWYGDGESGIRASTMMQKSQRLYKPLTSFEEAVYQKDGYWVRRKVRKVWNLFRD